MSATYPHGTDYEWFASDIRGRVARFTTGGLGPIPTVILEAEGLWESAQEELRDLPRRTTARLFASYPKMDDFVAVAEAGIYAYDCDDISSGGRSRSYRLVSVPTSPLSIADLPPLAREAVGLVALSGVEFGEAVEIGPSQMGPVVSAE